MLNVDRSLVTLVRSKREDSGWWKGGGKSGETVEYNSREREIRRYVFLKYKNISFSCPSMERIDVVLLTFSGDCFFNPGEQTFRFPILSRFDRE